MGKCLICADSVDNGGHYHSKCLQTLFGKTIGLNPKQVHNIKQNLNRKKDTITEIIKKSFLSEKMKEQYREVLTKRFNVLA